MEDSKIAFKPSILTEDSIPCFKVICSKCAGSGNFKTPENSRRTCLECFGKGFLNV
jgi:DnaJ-class molecular chaperone